MTANWAGVVFRTGAGGASLDGTRGRILIGGTTTLDANVLALEPVFRPTTVVRGNHVTDRLQGLSLAAADWLFAEFSAFAKDVRTCAVSDNITGIV